MFTNFGMERIQNIPFKTPFIAILYNFKQPATF